MKKKAFKIENMKSKYFGNYIMKISNLKMHIKRNTAHYNKELIKLGFGPTVVLVYIFE